MGLFAPISARLRPHRTAMASKSETIRPAARIYLVTPPLADIAAFSPRLSEALQSADVAAVLVRLENADERTLINRIKALARAIQESGAALLVEAHPEIVARAGADGAHLIGIDAFEDGAALLKPERIAGCGGLATRHDAMLAAEGGADYVMFGEPDSGGMRPSFGAVRERVAWWAEVFEVPCVGYAGTLAEAGTLAAAGADFVALGDAVWTYEQGPAAALRDAQSRLTEALA